jgi:hypothetical protein
MQAGGCHYFSQEALSGFLESAGVEADVVNMQCAFCSLCFSTVRWQCGVTQCIGAVCSIRGSGGE